MKRRLLRFGFTALSALSLLLCVAVCVVWARGQWSAGWFHWTRTGEHEWRRHTLVLGADGISVSLKWYFFDTPGHARKYAEGPPATLGSTSGFSHMVSQPQGNGYAAGGSFWNRLGFAMRPGRLQTHTSSDGPYRSVVSHGHVPYWFVLAVLSAPVWLWLARARARRRRARRARLGLCPQCGYDLRASPGRCPECGSEPAQDARPGGAGG